MRKILSLCFIIAVVMLLCPLAVLKKTAKQTSAQALTQQAVSSQQNELDEQSLQKTTMEEVSVYDVDDDKILKMPINEYLFGVVAGEMPALYEEEALKAQAVAAYTFTLARKNENKEREYDITTDHTADQAFKTKEKAFADWGENAAQYAEKIEKAIKSVEGQAITYNGEIITAAYHAISAGKTQNSEDVWGKERPYLKSVLSEGDKLNKNYISKMEFDETEIQEKLKTDETPNFENFIYTDSGYVKTVELCEKTLTGSEISEALELKSSCFEIEKTDGLYTFTVYGYGHGVGMSQAGADYMAKQGADYKEILLHYYTDCKIEKV